MHQFQLISALRQRLWRNRIAPTDAIADADAAAILAASMTCVCCGVRQLAGDRLATAIAQAATVDDFLAGLAPLWQDHTPPPWLFPERSSGLLASPGSPRPRLRWLPFLQMKGH